MHDAVEAAQQEGQDGGLAEPAGQETGEPDKKEEAEPPEKPVPEPSVKPTTEAVTKTSEAAGRPKKGSADKTEPVEVKQGEQP